MKVGIIGFGRRGETFWRLLRDLPAMQLVAVGDVDPAARQRAEADTGLPVFDSAVQLWPDETPDLAVIATPAAGRAPLIERVAASGVQGILTEKPLALTLSEADWVLTACTSRGVALSVGQHYRFCPELRTLRALVLTGELGRIESLQATGVGSLLDQGWHLLDACRWLVGGPRVVWAAAQGTNDRDLLARLGDRLAPEQGDPHHPGPLWMSAQLALDGDVRIWLETGLLSQKTGAVLGDWHERRIWVQGTNGSAECRPGHYLRVWRGGGAPLNVELEPASLDAATQQMVLEIGGALETGGEVPSPAADARQTLEGLLLCIESLRRQGVAAAPLAAADDPLRDFGVERPLPAADGPSRAAVSVRSSASNAPRYSVLIPLTEDRGHAEECLSGWWRQESFPAANYELLLLNDGTRDELAVRFAPRLRQQDRILRVEGAVRPKLYDLGARAARGEFLVLTESHCVPEPDFLRELERFLRRYDYDGACGRSIPVCHNNFARADAAAFETGYQQFLAEDDWRKVNIHAFALRRECYRRVGGFQPRYELFAEMVLAADLRDAGVRLGYAAGAAVRHHYCMSLRELIEFVDTFIRGELAYRLDHGLPERIGFSHLTLCERPVESEAALRACLRAEWERLRTDAPRGDLSALGEIVTLCRRLSRVGRMGRWRAAARLGLAVLRCWLTQGRPQRLQQEYVRLFYAAAHYAWTRHAETVDLAPGPRPSLQWSIAQFPGEWLIGFHPVEEGEGRMFRWSHPVAGIDLPLSAGEYDITIDCGGIRPWPASLRWSLDGREIPSHAIEYETEVCRLRVRIEPVQRASRRTLGLVCLPWDVSDPRRLGLPVFEITCRRLDDPAAAEDGAQLSESPTLQPETAAPRCAA
jgi:predicted dehydrogenase